MPNVQIPARYEFDVSEQVYEWLRNLSVAIEEQQQEDTASSINTLIAFLKQIEKDFESLKNDVDTTELINAKLKSLENKIKDVPDEIEELLLMQKSLKVATSEYSGTFANPDLTLDVVVNKIKGNAECFVEISSNQPFDSSALVTSKIIDENTVRLERGVSASSVQYVLKVKDYING